MARKVVLAGNFPEKDEDFEVHARDVVAKEQGNTLLPNLPVPPNVLTPLIDTFKGLIGKKGPGMATKRKQAREKVEVALRQNAAYTEGVLTNLPPGDIPAAAEGSGFPEKKRAKRSKAAWSVKRGANQGDALCEIKALGRHGTIQYCIAYSLDGGATWIEMPPTIDVSLTVHNLPVGKTVLFRFRTLIKGVYGDPSHELPFLVH